MVEEPASHACSMLSAVDKVLEHLSFPIDDSETLASRRRCHGINSHGNRCGNPLSMIKVNKACDLLDILCSTSYDSPHEAPLSDIEELLGLVHCHCHFDRAITEVREWYESETGSETGSETDSETGSEAGNEPHDSSRVGPAEAQATVASFQAIGEKLKTSPSSPPRPSPSTPRRLSFDEGDDVLPETPSRPSRDSLDLLHVVSELRIASRSPKPKRHSNTIVDEARVHVPGIGDATIAQLWRSTSKRDTSSFTQSLYKPIELGSAEAKPGIVYVFQHEVVENLYKIGITARTARARHTDSRNCYNKNTKIIYQTAAPFDCHKRAERLAHVFLRERQLRIKSCETCGRGHCEWFVGTEEEILHAVYLTERLVKLPGYTLQDGKMRLSPQIDEVLADSWKISMDKLAGLLQLSDDDSEKSSGSVDKSGKGSLHEHDNPVEVEEADDSAFEFCKTRTSAGDVSTPRAKTPDLVPSTPSSILTSTRPIQLHDTPTRLPRKPVPNTELVRASLEKLSVQPEKSVTALSTAPKLEAPVTVVRELDTADGRRNSIRSENYDDSGISLLSIDAVSIRRRSRSFLGNALTNGAGKFGEIVGDAKSTGKFMVEEYRRGRHARRTSDQRSLCGDVQPYEGA